MPHGFAENVLPHTRGIGQWHNPHGFLLMQTAYLADRKILTFDIKKSSRKCIHTYATRLCHVAKAAPSGQALKDVRKGLLYSLGVECGTLSLSKC